MGSELRGDCLEFRHWRDLVSLLRGENIRECGALCPGDRRPRACFGAVPTEVETRCPPPQLFEESLMSPTMFPLAADDRDRERELRARFAQFWSTATGDPRTTYDTFVSATPFAEGVSSEQVE